MDINLILGLYVLTWLSVFIHEFGHLPFKIKMVKWFPLPSIKSYSHIDIRYGGLLLNSLIAILVYIYHPGSILLQLFGLANYALILIDIFIWKITDIPSSKLIITQILGGIFGLFIINYYTTILTSILK